MSLDRSCSESWVSSGNFYIGDVPHSDDTFFIATYYGSCNILGGSGVDFALDNVFVAVIIDYAACRVLIEALNGSTYFINRYAQCLHTLRLHLYLVLTHIAAKYCDL